MSVLLEFLGGMNIASVFDVSFLLRVPRCILRPKRANSLTMSLDPLIRSSRERNMNAASSAKSARVRSVLDRHVLRSSRLRSNREDFCKGDLWKVHL